MSANHAKNVPCLGTVTKWEKAYQRRRRSKNGDMYFPPTVNTPTSENGAGRKELSVNETIYDLDEIRRNPVSRRAFFTRMTAAGLGVAAAGMLAGTNVACGGSDDNNDNDLKAGFFDNTNFPGIPGRNATEVVLNYALTLEDIEADLYRQALNAASGRPLTQALDVGNGESVGAYTRSIATGNLTAQQAEIGFLYLAQYGYVEATHRDFLRTELTRIGAPTVQPNARGYQLPAGTTANLRSILELIYAVEETGVRAYLGAAGFMNFSTATDKAYVQTAVAIHSTEARHSAGVAYILGLNTGPIYSLPGVSTGRRVTDGATAANSGAGTSEDTFQYYSDPTVVLNAVQPFIVK